MTDLPHFNWSSVMDCEFGGLRITNKRPEIITKRSVGGYEHLALWDLNHSISFEGMPENLLETFRQAVHEP